jgi:hypothetical protein
MRKLSKVLVFAAFCLLTACATPKTAKVDAASEKEVMQRVQLLLDRYARNDQAGVVAMLDPAGITMLGTSFDEKIKSPAELRALMERDFAQWQTAKVSDVRDVDVRGDGTLATVYFLMTWQAGDGPGVPIRLTTTWHRVNGEWLLTQSASALPPRF